MPYAELSPLDPSVLSTPLLDFEHEDTGSRISVVGAVHAGLPGYYRRLQTEIDEREAGGDIVHYETVDTIPDAEFDAAPFIVRFKIGSLALEGSRAYLSGLVNQQNAITYRDSWENHDMDERELAESLGVSGMLALRVEQLATYLRERNQTRDELQRGFREYLYRVRAQENGLEYRLSGIANRVIALCERVQDPALNDMREHVALFAVEDALGVDPEQSLTLFWGSAHLPGLSRGVEDMGYVLDDKQLVPAIDIEAIQ